MREDEAKRRSGLVARFKGVKLLLSVHRRRASTNYHTQTSRGRVDVKV